MKFEVWKSNENKTEVHIFKDNDQSTYVFGFNPELISWNDVVSLVANNMKLKWAETEELFMNLERFFKEKV